MAARDDSEIPESGAVFTFGKSKFADNIPNKFWVKNDRVLQIACGDEHTALIAETGRVFMFGPNDWGQLGLGSENKGANKPSCIKSLKHEKARLVACGRSHTLISTESGTVYSFGSNTDGQLGIPNITDSFSPKCIESLQADQFKILEAGSDSSVVLTADGKVFAWGQNEDGKLGLGDKETVMEPTLLSMEQSVVCVACGYYHTALVTEDGKLYTMGESDSGKLGLPDDAGETNVPQEVTDIPEPVKWVSCGSNHTVALTETGDVYVFGEGESGQLGLGTEVLSCSKPKHLKIPFKVSQVCCGQAFTALISEKGQLYTFGDGRHGKLAHGSDQFSNQFRPYHCKRFSKFLVDKVACGGCHMIVTARPKAFNGVEVDDDTVDEMREEKSVLDATDSAGSPTLSRSLSARERRRDEVKRSFSSMNQTLPPLGHNRALPSLSATMPALKSPPGKLNDEDVSRSLTSEVNGDLHNGKLSNRESAEDDFQEEKVEQLKKAKNSDDENSLKSGNEGDAGTGSEGDAENDDVGEDDKTKGKRKKEKKAKHRKKKETEDEQENLENELSKQLGQPEDSEHEDSTKDVEEEQNLPELKEEVDKAEDSWEDSAEELSTLTKNPVPVPRKRAEADGMKDEEKTSDLESEEEKDEEVHSEPYASDKENEKEEKEKEDKTSEKEDEISKKEDEVYGKEDEEIEKEEEEDEKKKGKKDKKDKKEKKDKKKKKDEEKEEEEEEKDGVKEEDSKDKGKKKDKKDKKKDKNKDKKKNNEDEEEEGEKEKEDEKADKKSKDKKKDKKGKGEDEEDEKEEKDEQDEEEEEEDNDKKKKDKKGKDKKKDKKEDKKKKKDDKKSKDENDNTETGTTKKWK